MPANWTFETGNTFARFEEAKIVFSNAITCYFFTNAQPGAQPERGYNAVLFFHLSVPRPVSFTLGFSFRYVKTLTRR